MIRLRLVPENLAQRLRFGTDVCLQRLVVDVPQNLADPRSNLAHLSHAHAAVVTAGVPRRTPLATVGFSGSYGIMFLLVWIPAWSRAISAALPVTP